MSSKAKVEGKYEFSWLIKKLIVKMNKERDSNSEEFAFHINRGALACFTTLCNNLSINNRITQQFIYARDINLSGCNINVYYAIEISNLIQKNTNIQILNLAGCRINAFALSCIFKAMIDHTGLKQLNLSNNQAFTTAVVQDFCKYVLGGKSQLQEINLSHCNIDNMLLAQIMDNTHRLQSLRRIKLSLMQINHESVLSLAAMMLRYTGKLGLENLDISYNQIQNDGIQSLAKGLFMSVRLIHIKSLNLSGNHISQTEFLEQILLKIKLEDLNLSHNQISEFQNQQVLNQKMLRIDLSFNKIEEIPNNFFLNVIYLNLSNNLIDTEGAYQISQILCSSKVNWVYLDLASNKIKTKGFISLVYALIENNKLISLSVSNNQINGEGVLVYIFNHEQIRLQFLDLSLNQLRYDLVYALISMMKESSLRTLILSSLRQDENEIQSGKNDCFEIKCTNLRELDFSGNSAIIYSVLESLSKEYNRLEYLNLSGCKLNTNILIERLCTIIEKTYSLATLLIANNKLGELNVSALEMLSFALSKNSTLINLDISNNRLKNSIVLLINGIANCSTLCTLNISHNLIDENEIIIKKLPLIFRNRNLRYVDMSKNWIYGQTLKNIQTTVQKNRLPFPQINLSGLRLTADDLLIISDIVSDAYSFKTLDISNNQSIDYLNNFSPLADNKVIEALTINKMQYRMESYQNLQQVMQLNAKTLKVIEISNTLISHNYLLTLLKGIQLTRQLTTLIFDYQVMENEEIIEAFKTLIKLKTLQNLQYFHIKKSTLAVDFFKQLKHLLSTSDQLLELNVSESRILGEKLQLLCDGIKNNNTLQSLHIANIKLDDKNFKILALALKENFSIRSIDLSRNNITQKSYYQLQAVFQNRITFIDKLKFAKSKKNSKIRSWPDYQYDFLINFSEPETNLMVFYNLKTLDLSRVKYQMESLQLLMARFVPNGIFRNVVDLKLDECQFEDSHCEVLQQMIRCHLQLKELSLACNNITYNGFVKLFSAILENKSDLEKLIVSNNQIKDLILKSPCQVKLKNFKLLLIDNNKALGSKDLQQFLEYNPGMYIYNTWTAITEELAIQVVESHILYSQRYNLKNPPEYMKNLIIWDSNLTDDFLIWFGSKYFRFPHLENLDLTGSTKASSSVGKMHLYISMINEQFMNYSLIVGKIENQQRLSNMFDDGMLYYILTKFKNYILKRNSPIKWIVNRINRFLFQYTDFMLSSSLYRFFRQNKKQIKVYSSVQLIAILLQGVTSILVAFPFQHIIDPREVDVSCANANPCYFNSHNNFIALFSIIYLVITLTLQIMNLLVAVKIRVKAIPDYCIRTFEEKRHQQLKLPHKKEIMLFFIQFIIKLDFYFECQVIGFCGDFIDYLRNQNINEQLQKKFLLLLLSTATLTVARFVWAIYANYINIYKLFKNMDADQATFFSYVWKISENNYVLERILRKYCPQIGIQVKNHLLNNRQISELLYALIIELPTLICVGFYFNLAKQYYSSQFQVFVIPSAYFLFGFAYLRLAVGFIFHLSVALTTRPPQVNGFDLNETLLLRKYQSMNKVEQKQINQKFQGEETKLLTGLQHYSTQRNIISPRKSIHTLDQTFKFSVQ